MHVGDDSLQPRHPPPGILFGARYEVEVLAFAFEDDGEAVILQRVVGELLQAFGLTAAADRLNVIDGDCGGENRAIVRSSV